MNRPTSTLWLRLALPFVAFVAIGSLALLAWLQHEEKRESRQLFAAMARTNVEFIRAQHLPTTERTAAALSEVLGVTVSFPPSAAFSDTKNGTPGEVHAHAGSETVRLPLDGATSLLLLRTAPAMGSIWQPRTLVVLGVFWLLTLALAYVDTRQQLTTERLAALGRMATGLAHEINNPVAAIKLHAQLLEADLPPEDAERIRVILGENEKIESLVNQWMFLTRPQPPQLAPCDLAELIAAAIRTHTPAAEHAAVHIVNEIATPLPIRADRRRLAQALANLFTNAIQATSARGGEVRITAAINHQPSTINLQITDTGPGFTEAALARATELFYSEKEGGMGIGLSVTAEIVKAHGGELKIANRIAGGAQVTIALPQASKS